MKVIFPKFSTWYTACLKIGAIHWYDYDLLLRQKTPCQLLWVHVWSGFCISTAEDPSLRFFATIHVKDQVLGNVFGGTISGSFQKNLSLHPHSQDSCSQLSIRSCIFCLIFEVVNWRFGYKSVYPTINLVFRRIIVKVKSPTKFSLYRLEWNFLQKILDAKYFSSLIKSIVIGD